MQNNIKSKSNETPVTEDYKDKYNTLLSQYQQLQSDYIDELVKDYIKMNKKYANHKFCIKIISDRYVNLIDCLRRCLGSKEAVIEKHGCGLRNVINGLNDAFERVDRRKEGDEILNKIFTAKTRK